MSKDKRQGRLMAKLPLTVLALLFITAGCGGGGGGSSSGGNGGNSGPTDTTAPSVTSMTPGEDTRSIATNARLAATFSEAMIPAAINTDNFRLTDGVNAIAGTVSYDSGNHIAVFTPANALTSNTRYTATVITGIKDLGGNPLSTDFAWCFVTGDAVDATAPSVTSSVPVSGAPGVATNSKISASFSEALNSSSLTPASLTLTGPGATPVSGSVSYLDGAAVFAPAQALAPNTAYVVTITTAVRDLAGNAVPGNVSWGFVTGTASDTSAPLVGSTSPAAAAAGVAISSTINVTFNEPMDPSTLTTANFTVTGPGTLPVIGTVSYDTGSNTVIFTRILHLTTPVDFHPIPVSYLDANTTYTATLGAGVKDMAGNALGHTVVWSFITAP